MKRSSILILVAIFIVFAGIQGWVTYTKFLRPASITTIKAVMMGDNMMVGTPVSGIVRTVNVKEGQKVEKGQPLFTIFQQTQIDVNGGALIPIVAQRAGEVYDIGATPDSFVQASQILARIVDTLPSKLFVNATLSVRPEQLPSINVGTAAAVRATFLNYNKPMSAVISSVGLYDGIRGTVDIQLKLLTPPTSSSVDTIVGLPVQVTVLPGADEGMTDYTSSR